MRAYNFVGYSLLVLHALVSALLAPSSLGPFWDSSSELCT